ncbi:hypothetical protein Tco_1383130 [Tanacetum coccineum]
MISTTSEEVGEDSDHPTDSNQIPIIDQPSTSSQPKQKQKSKRRQRKEVEVALMRLSMRKVLNLEKAKEIADLKKRVQRLERKKKSRTTGLRRLKKVDIDADVEVTLVNETQERQDDDLMFDTGVLDDDEVFVDVTTVEKEEQSTKIGEVVTTAGVEEEERQKQEEANISLIESWENTQAMMEADRLLAERLQTREREELTDEEKGKLFMELMEKRRKHFAALRAQEKRNRPPTKAQKRSQMSTYLKHMGGYKHKQLIGKSYDEIQKLFDKEMKKVNTFVAMSLEAQESNEKKVEGSEEKAKSSRKKSLGKKRAVKEQQQEYLKKQRMEDDKETDEVEEVEEDDEAELKKHLVIVKDDEITINAIPLATKPPMIFEYKLVKEGIMVHY